MEAYTKFQPDETCSYRNRLGHLSVDERVILKGGKLSYPCT